MVDENKLSSNLTEFVHDLFIMNIYKGWREKLNNQRINRWYSLIVELDKANTPIVELKKFGTDVYSKLTYRCIPSQDYKKTGELLILFTISGSLWHSLIYFSENK